MRFIRPGGRLRAFALALVTAGSLAPGPAAAAMRSVVLDYDLYFGGLQGVRLAVEIDLARDSYDMEVALHTDGLIGKLVPWTMKAWSRGRLLADAGLRPRSAGHNSIWRGKQRETEILFEHGRGDVVRIAPPPSGDDRDAVPAALRRDAIDLAGAVLSVARSMMAGGGCDRRVPVFDGRRRYDLVMHHVERATIERSRYSPFGGDVLVCHIEIDRIGGFKKTHASDAQDGRNRSILVYIGSVFDGTPPVPVRVEFETRFGAVRAHLARASTTVGDLSLSLAR